MMISITRIRTIAANEKTDAHINGLGQGAWIYTGQQGRRKAI